MDDESARLKLTSTPGIPITSSDFWQNRDELDEEKMEYVFRSATDEKMPMLKERLECLREAGQALYEVSLYHSSV